MRPTSRCYPDAVVLRTCPPASKPRAWSAGTTLRCSVQDGVTEMQVKYGGLHPETTAILSFPAPPEDTSAGARAATQANALGPEVNAGDTFTFAPPDGDGPPRVYTALAPCRRIAGRKRRFQVDARMTTR